MPPVQLDSFPCPHCGEELTANSVGYVRLAYGAAAWTCSHCRKLLQITITS